MEHLILARPGEYDPRENSLSWKGLDQMDVLGKSVKEILAGNDSVYIASASTPSSNQSAIVLARILEVPEKSIEISDYLNNLKNKVWPYVYNECGEFIESRRKLAKNGLVLVAEKPEVEALFNCFLLREWGTEPGLQNEVNCGMAIHICLKDRTYETLPRG